MSRGAKGLFVALLKYLETTHRPHSIRPVLCLLLCRCLCRCSGHELTKPKPKVFSTGGPLRVLALIKWRPLRSCSPGPGLWPGPSPASLALLHQVRCGLSVLNTSEPPTHMTPCSLPPTFPRTPPRPTWTTEMASPDPQNPLCCPYSIVPREARGILPSPNPDGIRSWLKASCDSPFP